MNKFKLLPLTVFALVVTSTSLIATNSFAQCCNCPDSRNNMSDSRNSNMSDSRNNMSDSRNSNMSDPRNNNMSDTRNMSDSKTVMVGGASMYPNKNIIENAVNSKDHTTLVAAVKAAGLVDTLSGKGPFTVFAPTNAAFSKLPAGTVDTLLKPENKTKLTNVLTYHVVSGKLSANDLIAIIKAGQTKLTTVEGEDLTIALDNGNVKVIDTQGHEANVTIADVFQSNGVIHVVDAVLMPTK
jgi:uncharacterized surface protein with fasciclin (FAS1) repeats